MSILLQFIKHLIGFAVAIATIVGSVYGVRSYYASRNKPTEIISIKKEITDFNIDPHFYVSNIIDSDHVKQKITLHNDGAKSYDLEAYSTAGIKTIYQNILVNDYKNPVQIYRNIDGCCITSVLKNENKINVNCSCGNKFSKIRNDIKDNINGDTERLHIYPEISIAIQCKNKNNISRYYHFTCLVRSITNKVVSCVEDSKKISHLNIQTFYSLDADNFNLHELLRPYK